MKAGSLWVAWINAYVLKGKGFSYVKVPLVHIGYYDQPSYMEYSKTGSYKLIHGSIYIRAKQQLVAWWKLI